MTQAIVYAKEKGVYPTSIKVLVEERYAAIPDKDPWGNDWVLSPVLTEGRTPREGDNVYVYSRGAAGTGVYPDAKDNGDGSVGYSSVDGWWEEVHHHHKSAQMSGTKVRDKQDTRLEELIDRAVGVVIVGVFAAIAVFLLRRAKGFDWGRSLGVARIRQGTRPSEIT